MYGFVIDNLSTMIVGLLLLGALIAIVMKLIRDKRKGKCVGCDCGCDGCSKGDGSRGK